MLTGELAAGRMTLFGLWGDADKVHMALLQDAEIVVVTIECRDGNIYTGITVDVAARYAAHARGKGARYTRSHPPRRLLATLAFPDRSAALKAEHQLKKIPAREKLRHVLAQGAATVS